MNKPKSKDLQVEPLPEIFGSMEHILKTVEFHQEMMKVFEINRRLAGIEKCLTIPFYKELLLCRYNKGTK